MKNKRRTQCAGECGSEHRELHGFCNQCWRLVQFVCVNFCWKPSKVSLGDWYAGLNTVQIHRVKTAVRAIVLFNRRELGQ